MKGILEHKNDINNYLKGENKMTRRVMKNNKGFSLIELLIVLAIIMVIAAIGIGLYSGLVGNTKEKADYAQAQNIAKVIQTYIVASGDTNLTLSSTTATVGTPTELLAAFQGSFQHTSTDGTNTVQTYGPYLENKNPAGTPNGTEYDPQWDGHAGWCITVYTSSQSVKVEPVKKTNPTNAVGINII